MAAAIILVAETRSFVRTAETLPHLLGHGLSAKTIERLAGQIGRELVGDREAAPGEKESLAPEVAVVSCDGGRIRTRAADCGPGVHNPAWRETKNASFERMTSAAVAAADPCPQLPATFQRVSHVAQIAEMSAFSAADAAPEDLPAARYEGPQRILRTCLASMARSCDFGQQMEREARRRRFYEAQRKVFVGDGQAWNWSLWETHFRDFTPVLDFIHAIQYAYAAAAAWEPDDAARWRRCLELITALWQGQVAEGIAALEAELAARGHSDPEAVAEHDPLRPLADAARYFRNNAARMDYPRYRREGLPITSSPMESLIKQINQRVKGTEMFWNDPEGAEAILQIRAASLCEDGRLADYLSRRPGCAFTRRPAPTTATQAA